MKTAALTRAGVGHAAMRQAGTGVLALALWAVSVACLANQDRLDVPAMKSTLAQRSLLTAVTRAGQRLVAVGQRGHILYSDDQGQHWTQADVPVSVDLTAVAFPTPQKGWAVGHDGVVLATQDGGAHWVKQLDGRQAAQGMKAHYDAHPPQELPGGPAALASLQADIDRMVEEGPDKPFLDVWFADETTGYVVGLFNLIFRTTDAGKTWTPLFDRTDNPKRLHLYAVRPAGPDLYVAGEQGLLLKLDKASQRFQALPVDYNGTFFGIQSTAGAVLVYGLRGNVFRSDDQGASWKKVATGVNAAITASTRLDDGRVVLISQGGHVLVSSDDGQSFAPLQRAAAPASSGVAGVSAQALVIANARGVLVHPLHPAAAK